MRERVFGDTKELDNVVGVMDLLMHFKLQRVPVEKRQRQRVR